MGTMSVLRKTPCPPQKVCKQGYLVFHRKRLEPRVLPWQQYSRCHFVSFVMYIIGATFEDHCSNISGDILKSVFYCFSGTIYIWRHHFLHLHNTKIGPRCGRVWLTSYPSYTFSLHVFVHVFSVLQSKTARYIYIYFVKTEV